MTAINVVRRFGDISKPAGQTIAGGQLVYASAYPATRTVTDGATTSGSATVTSATADFAQADVGDTVSGAGIPAGSTILTVNSASSVTLSATATATATGVSLTITVPANPDNSNDDDAAYVAGANAVNVIGVAMNDAQPYNSLVDTTTGQTPVMAYPVADRVTVVNHCEVNVTYAAAATCGEKLVAAANGQVTPYTAGTSTFDEIVGYCLATTAAGAVGPAYIGGI